ncbi:MAG: TonB-dependent receptor, partial [Gammaproteobacteria bacterium]
SFDNGSFGAGISHTLDQAIGVNLEGALTPAWSHRLSLGTAREDIDTPAFASAYRSTREQLGWTNDFTLSDAQHLIAGLDFNHDRGQSIDSSGFGAPYAASRNNSGVFGGWRATQGAVDGEVSARYDHNSSFGNALSGSGAFGYRISDALRFIASYGTAFRAPTLNELHSPGYGGYFAGNPGLDAERSRTAELGLDWTVDAANRLGARAFSTRVHDLIDFSGGSKFQAINIAHAAIDGVELTHVWQAAAWTWTNALTAQNPRNDDTGAQLLRRPKQKFSSLLETALSEAVSVGAELAWSGKRYDIGGKTLDSYTLVNLRASYAINSSWHLGLRVENVFDKDYALVQGYNTPGRSAYVTVSFEPHF